MCPRTSGATAAELSDGGSASIRCWSPPWRAGRQRAKPLWRLGVSALELSRRQPPASAVEPVSAIPASLTTAAGVGEIGAGEGAGARAPGAGLETACGIAAAAETAPASRAPPSGKFGNCGRITTSSGPMGTPSAQPKQAPTIKSRPACRQAKVRIKGKTHTKAHLCPPSQRWLERAPAEPRAPCRGRHRRGVGPPAQRGEGGAGAGAGSASPPSRESACP
jgi:hypothetical protein